VSETKVFHPVQTDRVRRDAHEPVVLAAYEVYCEVYGPQPAIIDLAKGCRGGFHADELIAYLYARAFPRAEWRQRVNEAFERQAVSHE
jgi:hypothetical protein